MKTVTSLLLVALLVASALADCVTRNPVDVYVGDHTSHDQVLSCSGSLQSVALPATSLGGHDALTIEVEVYPRAFTGCVYSYGSGADYVALKFVQDSNNHLGQVHFVVGGAEVSTQGVLLLNQWQNLAVVVQNNAPNSAGQITGAIATIYIDGVAYPSGAVGTLTSTVRSGSLGYCSAEKTYFNGAVDNLILTATAKSVQDIKDTHTLIYPFVLQNDLIQMWSFNDDGSSTTAFTGLAATNAAVATVVSSTGAALCSRVSKATFSGARVTDVFCSHSGSVGVSGSNTFTTGDGLSQTFACNGGADFTFNQKWSGGAIVEVTIKTSLNHRFRVGANADGALLVDHQSWGGWTRLSSGSGIITEDRAGYSIDETTFVIQAANIGWIQVTQAGGFLNYQYALDSGNCAAATCNFLTAQQGQYDFSNPPLPEPMGNQPTADGIQGLPSVLACPTPTLTGYNPFMYCWGWWVGPQVGYSRDWNGNPWQTSDPGCCRNQAILDGSQWTIQRWGYLTAGKVLPWCESYTVPPLDPPKSATSLPTYPTNPCTGIDSATLTNYQTICAGLWGSDTSDGRYVGCVAQLCITSDPTTVPPPDCRTEKLLATLDSNYVVPSTCNSCPNSCSFQGTCNPSTLVCTCQSGFTGPDCSQPTSYPCIAMPDGTKIQPYQLLSLDTKFPNSPVLDISMDDAIYTQFAFPGKYSIADTLFIYLAQSIDAFNSPNAEYHLWAVSGNGAGSVAVDYTVTITSAQFPGSTGPSGDAGAELDVLGNASPVGAGSTQTSSVYPNLDRAIVAGQPVSIRITHGAGQVGGFVLRKLPSNFQGTITLTANGVMIPQVLLGGASTSAKAVFDVVKISAAQMTSGFSLGGTGTSGATVCSNPSNGCALLNCQQCVANTACGWCVETAQCQQGTATGPAFGECLNWRKTFDATTNRRVTQIPAYPVNPGLTEVFLGSNSDLPIQVGLTPAPFANSEWDAILLSDMASPLVSQAAISGQIQDLLSQASAYPNMGIAFGSIIAPAGYQLIAPITNPRATDAMGIPNAIQTFSTAKQANPATSTLANMKGALAKLAATDDFALRKGTRKMVLLMSQRDNDGTLDAASAQALLVKNIVPVFAVVPRYFASYQALVRSIGFGYVIQITPGLASLLSAGLSVAGSSVNIMVPTADASGTNIDMTTFNTNVDRFTVINLPSNFRALFSVPVKPIALPTNAALTTHLVFPGYGNALIENIPAALAEKPWTTGITSLSTKDNAGAQLIELTGLSFRGLMAVTPAITAVPDTTVGDLHYAVWTTDSNGVTSWTAGDLITSAMLPQVIGAGKVVFLPKAAGSTSFSYNVADMCVASAPGTVAITVLASDQAPVAGMPNLVTRQYTPLTFELGFGDDSINSGGQYTFTITQTVAAADGALYQYYSNFDYTNPDPAKLITSGQTITGQLVIYMPPQYKYSDATNPALLTLPCFNYKVTETSPNNLPSNEVQVLITVTHVNVPPFVWDDAAWPSALLGPWPAVDASWCKDTCSFQEDFGEQYWWNAGFEYIYLGGNDVEGSILAYELTQVDCFPGTTILIPLENNRNAVPGDKILQNQPGALNPTLRFRPARETSNTNRAALDGAAHYCTIGYHVIDDQGAVSSDKSITINITPVNKQPRLDDSTLTVVALEQQRQQFFLDAIDPEGDAFQITFLGCAANQGVVELCADSNCATTVTLDCSVVYDATNPQATVLTGVQAGQVGSDGITLPVQGFFTSGPVATFAQGQGYNTIYLSFADTNSVSSFPATQAQVIFDVKVLNTAPVLTVQGQDQSTYTAQVSATESFTPVIQVIDPDFNDQSFYVMTVDVTLDNSNTPAVVLNTDRLQQLAATYDTCQDGLIVSATQIHITCGLASVNELLFAISLAGPQQVAKGQGEVKLSVTANDNGFVGQCDVPYVTNAACPLSADLVVTVDFSAVQDTSLVTVASSSAAAGVAGAAAIAAVALFRKFNKKAEDNYEPWEDDVNDDSTAVNPLYQESGSKGENPLFEAANPL